MVSERCVAETDQVLQHLGELLGHAEVACIERGYREGGGLVKQLGGGGGGAGADSDIG